tara:strand:- start:717 stop:1640 length:924 start_codon:yes stop_codon:yes gene_type:complete
MGFSVTSNYAGSHAGQYIAAALKEAKSLEYLTVLENVKFKRNITKVASSGLIVDANCDFTDAGTLTLTERVLQPENLQINVDLCALDLLADFQAEKMRAGAHNNGMSDDFAAFVVSYLQSTIADHVETKIWQGNISGSGEFTGFMGLDGNGHFENDTAIVEADNEGGAGTAFTATNIDENLNNITVAIPSAVYGKEDLYIYMSTASYRLYIQNMAAAGYANLYSMTDTYVPMFNGIKIAVCPGMRDNKMCAAQKSNLFFGTDLISDHGPALRILDMSEIDGSSNLRVVAKFSGGTQHAQGGDIVRLD